MDTKSISEQFFWMEVGVVTAASLKNPSGHIFNPIKRMSSGGNRSAHKNKASNSTPVRTLPPGDSLD